ncbi:hypothetical protein OQ968_21940 [Mycobacterium sp. 663a-19]|uniref:hypothetical protein n=1 Tax=Mycobacterium sp. 663a-19 TaxID=2986148 RepID=UPI002D1EC150|nr:hypothetical protein [Mycobacterium sp. 663a-19]MEB3983915.1 hypothetical protein [Mycobacterium sp. 663a-19]
MIFTGKSERTVMLGTILLVSAVSATTGYFLTQCYSVDILSSLLLPPEDCWLDWGMKVGRHCFGDYGVVVDAGMRPNPFKYTMFPGPGHDPFQAGGPPAGMLPHLLFGLPAKWLGAPRLGLVCDLLALTIAVLAPAVWASRGVRGLERVVVFVALGAAAIPVWAVIDRANSVGFVVPIALVFLVALCRQQWGLVTFMVILAALVKPQFAVLAVALFVVRQWRWGCLALGGMAISNLASYLLWPRDFPATIPQSIHNLFHFTTSFTGLTDLRNVSFGRALLLIPDSLNAAQTGGKMSSSFLAGPRSLIGYGVLALVVACVLALGRRIPPVMAGIVLLAAATLFPSVTNYYYLVFVLPVAALVVRDPDGPPGAGIFDRLAIHDGRRRAVGIWVSLATALSIAQIAVPILYQAPSLGQQLGLKGASGTTLLAVTTVPLAPFLWLIACAVIIVSYTRRAGPSPDSDGGRVREGAPDPAVSTSPRTCELMTDPSPQGLA